MSVGSSTDAIDSTFAVLAGESEPRGFLSLEVQLR